jgi:hypothetical protein
MQLYFKSAQYKFAVFFLICAAWFWAWFYHKHWERVISRLYGSAKAHASGYVIISFLVTAAGTISLFYNYDLLHDNNSDNKVDDLAPQSHLLKVLLAHSREDYVRATLIGLLASYLFGPASEIIVNHSLNLQDKQLPMPPSRVLPDATVSRAVFEGTVVMLALLGYLAAG